MRPQFDCQEVRVEETLEPAQNLLHVGNALRLHEPGAQGDRAGEAFGIDGIVAAQDEEVLGVGLPSPYFSGLKLSPYAK